MKNIVLFSILFFLAVCVNSQENDQSTHELVIEYLEVPENRTKINGKTIKLAYTILSPIYKNTNKEPIVFLQGGPGGPSIFMAEFFKKSPLHKDRAIIFMDQRGTGLSNAICESIGTKIIDILRKDLSLDEEEKDIATVLQQCKREAVANDYDFSAYNSSENAADFEALRTHLGYEKWNLFGGSYGSRLGLTMMRDYPKGIKSAILGGIFAPESNLHSSFITNYKRALTAAFKICENTPECQAAYPNIEEDFFTLLKKLKKKPYISNLRGKPFAINAKDLTTITHQLLYDKETIRTIPFFIKAFETPNNDYITTILEYTLSSLEVINIAMYLSVNAYEELPFNGYQSFRNDHLKNPEFPDAPAFFNSIFKKQDTWHEYRASDIENQAVVSDIPTLLVNGQLDPITPPSNAKQAVKSLENGHYAEFKEEGHNFFNACFMKVSLEFFDAPTKMPDFSCTDIHKSIQWKY